jgi:hypothetical protein
MEIENKRMSQAPFICLLIVFCLLSPLVFHAITSYPDSQSPDQTGLLPETDPNHKEVWENDLDHTMTSDLANEEANPLGNPYKMELQDGIFQGGRNTRSNETVEFTLYLEQGWNLVSIPLNLSNTSLTSVLQSIDGEYTSLSYYDSSNYADPWKHHNVLKPANLNDLHDLQPNMGFWIYITKHQRKNLTISDKKFTTNLDITLHRGWNLVGYPCLQSFYRTYALNNIEYGQELDSIQYFDAKTKTWHEIASGDSFEPGRGYYFHLKTDIIWTPPTQDQPDITPGIEHSYKYKDQDLLYYVPFAYENNPQETRIFFQIHGAGRQYEDNFDVWMMKNVSELYNVVLVCPHFDKEVFTKYQRLNVGYGERADLRLIELSNKFTDWLNLTQNTSYIFGFSGGGQFTHRFVMAHPEYIERAVAAGSGVYTFPNSSIAYPHGLNLTEYEPIDLEFDLEVAYRANMSIMIGLNDTERSDDLSKSEASDAQGLNRLERARNFINATKEHASDNGWELNYSYLEVPDCGHSYGPIKPYVIDYLFRKPYKQPDSILGENISDWWDEIVEIGVDKWGIIDPYFLAALVKQESWFRPDCFNAAEKEAYENGSNPWHGEYYGKGLLQITGPWIAGVPFPNSTDWQYNMPPTAIYEEAPELTDAFNGTQNLNRGFWYIKALLEYYDYDQYKVASAYRYGWQPVDAGSIDPYDNYYIYDVFGYKQEYLENVGLTEAHFPND